jgi:hypothetical protein
MKLAPEAMGKIKDMVINMMPYDFDHEAASNEANLINNIFMSVSMHKPEMSEWKGFVGYLCKQIDEKQISQDAVKKIALDMKNILEQYFEK